MKNTKNALIIAGVAVGIIASVFILYKFKWSGFGEDLNKLKSIEKTIKDGKIIITKEIETEQFQSGKTLWDWLGLGGTIAIPIMIYVFQAGEQLRAEERAKAEKEAAETRNEADKEIAEANLREDAVQAYIDRMSDILIDKERCSELFIDKNGNENKAKDNPVRDIVRVRTTTILRRLENDTKRQARILSFLRDAELFKFIFINSHLDEANLRNARLTLANFTTANLQKADLSNARFNMANFTGAFLMEANLSKITGIGANLTKAHLTEANLASAFLNSTNLTGAWLNKTNLTGASLRGTNFTKALLTNANLASADLASADLTEANLASSILIGADLTGAKFKNVKNLTVEQIKAAKNWEKANYDPEFRALLGLPPETPT